MTAAAALILLALALMRVTRWMVWRADRDAQRFADEWWADGGPGRFWAALKDTE